MKKAWVAVSVLSAHMITVPVHGQHRSERVQPAGEVATQQLELAGIRVGMPAPEVAPVLTAAGYRRHQSGLGPSWDTSVARLAAERGVRLPESGEVPGWESFVKGPERVEVRYRPTPAGAVVYEVAYTINADAIATQRLRTVLIGRYGRAGWDNGVELLYCSRGERVCSQLAFIQGLALPAIYVLMGPTQHSIELRSGARIWEAHQASLRAEVDRRAPRMRSPTF